MANTSVVIAIAQINSRYQDIEYNFNKHLEYITKASDFNADIIIFPELSMTSYSTVFDDNYIFNCDDKRLKVFDKISRDKNVIVVFGAPVIKNDKKHISSIVQFPDGKRKFYFKNYLHHGENKTFSSGDDLLSVDIKGERIGFGICYDVENIQYIERISKLNATINALSIFYGKKGIIELKDKLRDYTIKFNIDIAVSNYVGDIWTMKAGGGSMFLSSDLSCVNSCSDSDESLMICTKEDGNWSSQIVEI